MLRSANVKSQGIQLDPIENCMYVDYDRSPKKKNWEAFPCHRHDHSSNLKAKGANGG